MKKLIFLAAWLIALSMNAEETPLVSYSFDAGNMSPAIGTGVTASNLTNNNVSFAIAATSVTGVADDSHSANGGKWIHDHGQGSTHVNADNEANAINPSASNQMNDYLSFTVTPAALHTLKLGSLTFDIQGRTTQGSAPLTYYAALYSSKTGWTAVSNRIGTAASVTPPTIAGTGLLLDSWKNVSFDISNINMDESEAIEFRLYVWYDSKATSRSTRWLEFDNINVYGISEAANVDNFPPSITSIANQMVANGSNTGLLSFTVSDKETLAASLSVSAVSDNTAVVPNNQIVLSGPDAAGNCTLSATPVAGGIANITVTVEDAGGLKASTSFRLTATIDLNAHGEGISENFLYGYVPGAALTVPQRQGYRFGGWYLNSEFNGEPVTAVTSVCDLYAQWIAIIDVPLIVYNFDDATFNPIYYGETGCSATPLANSDVTKLNFTIATELTDPHGDNGGKWIREHGQGQEHINADNGATTADDYLTFTITPAAGQALNVSKFTFDLQARTGELVSTAIPLTYYAALFSSQAAWSGANQIGTTASAISTGTANTVSGWTTVNIDLSNLSSAIDEALTFRLYVWRSGNVERREERWMELDNITVYQTVDASSINPFIVAADETKDWNEYLAGDITIVSDENSTGQINLPSTGLKVNGTVHLQKIFTPEIWYPAGFPFEIEHIGGVFEGVPDDLYIYNPDGTQWGDFWVKAYNGDAFEYSPRISANTGYIFQYPTAFDGVKVTFSSEANPELKKGNECDFALISEVYTLLVNPSVNNLVLSAENECGNAYYIYNYSKKNFDLLSEGTAEIKPFESFVAVKGIEDKSLLRSAVNVDTATGIVLPSEDSDSIVHTSYYTLQGIRISQPRLNETCIVKNVSASGKTKISKIINRK